MPDHAEPRTIAEDLLLLAWNERTGRPYSWTSLGLHAALGGSLLIELALGGHLTITDGRPDVMGHSTGNALLDRAAEAIRSGPSRRKVKGWVRKLGTARLRRQVRDTLVEAGALEARRRRLGPIPLGRRFQPDPAVVAELRARCRAALRDSRAPDDRTAALLAVAGPSGVLDRVVDRRERRAARRTAQELAAAEPAAAATRAVVRETQAAVIAVLATGAAVANR